MSDHSSRPVVFDVRGRYSALHRGRGKSQHPGRRALSMALVTTDTVTVFEPASTRI